MTDLRIASPCHESWDAMTPNSAGRHCASCDKTVVDVTAMVPVAARTYLDQELPTRLGRGERVCVRAHVDRRGHLLRGGVKRRLLTNGLAAVLAMAMADYAGFGNGLMAAEGGDAPPTSDPRLQKGEIIAGGIVAMPEMGKVAGPDPVILQPEMGDVKIPTPPVKELMPVTEQVSGITVHIPANSFRAIGSDRSGKEVWAVDLTTCGLPADAEHRPTALRLDGKTVVVSGGDRMVTLSVVDGRPFDR